MDSSTTISTKKPLLLTDLPGEMIFKIAQFILWKELFLQKRINRKFYDVLTSNEHRILPKLIDLVSFETDDFSEALVILNIDGETEAHLLTDLDQDFFKGALIKKVIYTKVTSNRYYPRNNDLKMNFLEWLSGSIVNEFIFRFNARRPDDRDEQPIWLEHLKPMIYTFCWSYNERELSLRVPGSLKDCFFQSRSHEYYANPTTHTELGDLMWHNELSFDKDGDIVDFVKALHRGQIRLQGVGSVWIEKRIDNLKGLMREMNGYLSSFKKFTTNRSQLMISERELVLFVGSRTVSKWNKEISELLEMKLVTRPTEEVIEENLKIYGTGYLI